MIRDVIVGVLATCLVAAPALAGGRKVPGPVRRVAVVVGSNRAVEGREPLRFAHSDAQRMAETLTEVGGFGAGEVRVLLDPEPEALLAEVDAGLQRLRGGDGSSMLLFYYSGHASADALFPNGKELRLDTLRDRLARDEATVRVGILDACRGGGWTRSKGLQPVQPFEVAGARGLSSSGTVLIASSSGLQDAHESDALQGSFFTHHLVAGLRGAADRSGEGEVTLGEAFSYARERTIRDSALHAPSPQSPSFDMQLRGREELTLARVGAGGTVLELRQSQGPLELIQLQSGVTVLELPRGERAMRLAVQPGTYLVRRRDSGGTRAQELTVAAGQTVAVSEEGLTLVGRDALASKKSEAVPPQFATTLPAGRLSVGLSGGIMRTPRPSGPSPAPLEGEAMSGLQLSPALSASLSYAFTDRLQLSLVLPRLAYRFGERGGFEWVPWGGITALGGASSGDDFNLFVRMGAGLDARWWFSPTSSVNGGASADWGDPMTLGRVALSGKNWTYSGSLGLSHYFNDRLAVHMGLAGTEGVHRLGLGAVQSVGGRHLPLVQVRVTDWLSVDGNAALDFDLRTGEVGDRYTLGVSGTF